jgi:predicted 3-demethylubiquinone-9 3-methyltransferase (glyoxalase superfamily)
MKVSGPITPCLWFNKEAEEAAKFYVSIFENSKMGNITYYSGEGQDVHGKPEGSVLVAEFEINGQKYMGLNGGPQFKFTEAISLQVPCESQKEIDYFTERLIAGGGEQGACGWLKDKFGLSWQVYPVVLLKMLSDPDRKKVDRVTKAYMKMMKFDVAGLERAYSDKAA